MDYLLLAIVSAVLYGVWKFGLGIYRGRISVFGVLLVSASTAGVVYVVAGLADGDLVFDGADIARGLVGGLMNCTGTLLVLKAYERGKMGVVTGVAATSVLVPLVYSLLLGEEPSAQRAIGVLVILAGLGVFYVPHMRVAEIATGSNSRQAIVLALAAALFWGLAIVVIDNGSRVSVTGTLAVSQVPQVIVALSVLLWTAPRSFSGLTGRSVAILVGAGLSVGLANIAFYTAAQEGNIGLVSVLASLSPMVTALLAFAVLKERLSKSDVAALAIVLVGVALIVG